MSRPIKEGLDFFYVDIAHEDKVSYIEAKHGLLGYGVLIKLWKRIYKNGYWCEWTEKSEYVFAKEEGVELLFLRDVVNTCFDEEIFSISMYKKRKILTSSGVQKFWIKVVSNAKRKHTKIDPEISLLSNKDVVNRINSGGNPAETPLTPENPSEKVHKAKSKVKEEVIKQLDPKELDRLIIAAAASGNGEYNRLVTLGIQAAAAKNNYYNFDEKSETLKSGDKMLIIGFGKTKSEGIVSPTLYLDSWIENLKNPKKNETQKDEKRGILPKGGGTGVVFK